MTPKRNDIIDYTVPAESVSVANGVLGPDEVVPLLVVTVAEDGKSYSGFAFLPSGTTEYVTFTDAPPAAPAPKYDAQTGKLIADETWTYDPVTGEKLTAEPHNFDPVTGAPLNVTPTPEPAPAPSPAPEPSPAPAPTVSQHPSIWPTSAPNV